MSQQILMIIPPEQFRDEELQVPRKIFQDQGWTVDTVSTQTGMASGMLGARENITQDLSAIAPDTYGAVVVVGGMGSPSFLWQNTQLHSLLNTMATQGKVIASICLSGAVLAIAGLLNGKEATVWEAPESLEALKNGGATYTGQPVTVDGQMITANGPDAAETFAKAIVIALNAKRSHPSPVG